MLYYDHSAGVYGNFPASYVEEVRDEHPLAHESEQKVLQKICVFPERSFVVHNTADF